MMNTYNNNQQQQQLNNTTYSGITFANPNSKIMQSRLSISYFNKMMVISIALRNNADSSNDAYATYDNDGKVSIYLSFSRAKVLSNLIKDMMASDDRDKDFNVCIETNTGLLKVSNGKEFGSTNYCISISTADESGKVIETIYETKPDYTGAYNYSKGNYESKMYPDMEIETLLMVLDQYYLASSYAIAATCMEASMYKREATNNMIKKVGEAVGVSTDSGSAYRKNYQNKSQFLTGGGNSQSDGNSNGNYSYGDNGTPKEYTQTSFDDIINSMNS